MAEVMAGEKKRGTPVLDPARMKLAETARLDHVVDLPDGVTMEEVLDPAFWAHTGVKMHPHDHIEVRAEDGSWSAELQVLGCDRNWARVHLKHKYEYTTADVSLTQSAKYYVKRRGPHLQFCVIRLSDQQVIKEKCLTQAEAEQWMQQHERVAG